MVTWATPVEARMGMLPKSTYTDGVPASRNATSSSGSGRSSGTIQGPVCTMSRSVGSCHGSRVGSVASHGWSHRMRRLDNYREYFISVRFLC